MRGRYAAYSDANKLAINGAGMSQEDEENVVTVRSVYQKKRLGKTAEHRKQIRHPVHWRVAIVHHVGDRNDIYHGRTHDLSAWGAGILVEHNIFMMGEVVMLLGVPPVNPGQKETIIEIQCRMVYTVLDSEENLFRIGIRFLHFKGDGKKVLTDILSGRVIPSKSGPAFSE